MSLWWLGRDISTLEPEQRLGYPRVGQRLVPADRSPLLYLLSRGVSLGSMGGECRVLGSLLTGWHQPLV